MNIRKYSAVLLSILVLGACQEENLQPGIPALVRVDQFNLNTSFNTQGTSSHKITDVWVFADDQTIGVFELPIVVPVLKSGIGKLRLEAGIKLNGIKTTRVNNPFFEPVIIESFLYKPDSVVIVNPVTTYRSSTVFVWMEDFEDAAISIDTTRLLSKASIEKTTADEAFEGNYSGIVELTAEKNTFEAASFESFVLPVNGDPVFLEMNYKNDYIFSVGIFSQTSSQIIKEEIIYLQPQEEWNKIYINLTETLMSSQNAETFKIFIRTALPDDLDHATIYLDNIKLMYR
ncbi:MAG TPA: hypothetical protein PLI65_08760 [Bacteroidales bacterium]|nr:hypothetical protein [Bacteroidales bacterium]HPR57993.1 hypothetical protein [Bacteroidales bacterium]HRW96632.1 hypothetical protein [Bacteroidales bacterium]